MADLSTIRLREDAVDVRWVLFIDGCQYAWTTDVGQGGLGTLLGSGASSWIGLSEASIGGVESVGARTVLGGLEMPQTIREALNVKSGTPDPNPVTFRLHDVDGIIGNLFAREGKDYDILRSRIAPGTTATAATAVGPGGGSINLWGRNIGNERIGAAGQRRLFPALPYTLVGFDHAVHQNAPFPGELPPVQVSDEPLSWAGRLVTLYAIYRDPDDPSDNASAWPTWDDQDAAGNRAWVGVLRGVTRQRGRVYELDCHGRDAMFRRQLGTVNTGTWMPVSAELNYGEDSIAILFNQKFADGSPSQDFDGSVFDRTLTATTKQTLITEINGFIQDAYDGTSQNYTTGGGGDLDAWVAAGAAQDAQVGLDTTGFYVRKNTQATNQRFLVMTIVLPSRVWRQLGYEPETQDFDNQHEAPSSTKQIHFWRVENGEDFGNPFPTGNLCPGDGYWAGEFTSIAVGYTQDLADSNEWDNDGARRYHLPKFEGEPFTLDMTGDGQIVRLGGAVSPYIEGQLTVYFDGADVDGSAADNARYFAIRGKVALQGDDEPFPTVQIGIWEWNEDGHGGVDVGATGVQPAFRVVRWLDPRLFGFNYRLLSESLEYWTGLSTGEGLIEAAPLHAYAYFMDDTPEYANNVLTQIWLSTGSGGGYSVAGSITSGDNSPGALPGQLFFGDDLELADLGLSIPYQLVADLDEIQDAFDTVPGGWDGPLNRIRLAYVGPFQAEEAIESILRPRRLLLSYHGDVFGVVKLAPFSPDEADVTILERDLYSADEDPRSLMPDQLPAPVGHLDGVEIRYRSNPADGKTSLVHIERARDADARSRTGDLIVPVDDHGLVPWPWGVKEDQIGVAPWFEHARELWGFQAAEFFGKEHFMAVMTVSRPKGQDLRIGTRVLLTNPWLVDSAGNYGVTSHVGLVVGTELDTAHHSRRAEIFVFAGQAEGFRYFAPMARVLDQSGAVLTLDTDQYGHGEASIYDAQGLVEPSWSSVGGDAVAQILYRIGSTWTLGSTHTVSSYNTGTGELTLGTTPTTDQEYTDRWVLLATYDSQTADEYVRALFGAIVLDTTQHGTGPTDGWPFQQ